MVDAGGTAPAVMTPTGVESNPTPVRGMIACHSTASDDLSGVNFVSFWLFDQLNGGWNGVGTQAGLDQTMPLCRHDLPGVVGYQRSAGRALQVAESATGCGREYRVVGSRSTWMLQMREVGARFWNTVASGSSSVVGGTLFALDTGGYPLGSYQLQLVVTDTAGNTSTDLVTPFVIDNTKPTVVSATAAGCRVVDAFFSQDRAPGSIGSVYFASVGCM